jgi:3-methyladenine DNA glycosylase/8-oxoguanine DNA glycosylase
VEAARSTVTLTGPVDVRRTLAPLRRGPRDPAYRTAPDGAVWRATRTNAGPVSVRVRQVDPRTAEVHAWGPGAAAALEVVPGWLGAHDDVTGFDPQPGPVRDAFRRTSTVRLGRTGQVLEALVPAVLEQRVITHTAQEAWRWLLDRHGEPAPGPAPEGMRVPPTAATWAAVPPWAGVDPRRARAVVAAARVAHRLELTADLPAAEAWRRLVTVPGIGAWTAAETVQRSHGDPDAVSVGDYHLPAQVGWALSGQRVDDEGMLALLEPYRPHRHRAVRHLLLAGLARAPRRGPRLAVEDHRFR